MIVRIVLAMAVDATVRRFAKLLSFRGMAGAAVNLCMLPVQRKIGLLVRESDGIQLHDVRIAAQVFRMTRRAL